MKIRFTVIGILIIIALILGAYYLGGSRYRPEIDRLNLVISDATLKAKKDSFTIAGVKHYSSLQEVAILSKNKYIKQLEEDRELLKKLRMKDVQTIANLEVQIVMLEKQGAYINEIHDTITVTDSIPINTKAEYKDKWVEMSVVLAKTPRFGLRVDNIPINLVIGTQRQGLFRSTPMVSVVTTTNPYLTINRQSVVIKQENKKWYQTKWAVILPAVGVGYLLGK